MLKFLHKSIIGGAVLLIITSILSGPVATSHLCLSPGTAIASAGPSNASENFDDAPLLAPGEQVQQELPAGKSHFYRLNLTSGQYLRVLLNEWSVDARITIYAPEGQAQASVKSRRSGLTPLSIISEASGEFRLEVRSLDEHMTAGWYEVRIEEIREAVPKDQYGIAAERISAEGEALRAEERRESLHKAIEKYVEALVSSTKAVDRREEANSLKNIGEIYQRLGEAQKALKYYKRALPISRSGNNRRAEGELLNDIGFVYISLGENQKALEYCSRALRLYRALGDQRGESQSLSNIGEFYYWSGNPRKALEYYQQALSILEPLKDRRAEALVLLYFGYIYSDLGETERAFEAYRKAQALWQVVRDQRKQAITLTALGRLHSRVGESQEALNLFNQAMQLIRPIGDIEWEASISNGMGYVYDKLGEKQRALDCYSHALQLFHSISFRSAEAYNLYDIGRIYSSLGDQQKALSTFQQVLSISPSLDDRRLESFALREIGVIYYDLGDKAKALEHYKRARSLNQSAKDRRGETDTLNLIGRIYDERGDKRKALDYYNRALALSRAAEHRFGEASTLYNIARVERDLSKLDEARAHALMALGIVESLRAKVISQDLRTSYFASVQQHYELYINLLMQLHKQRPAEGFDVTALEASERARARSMLETLSEARADIRQGVDAALIERERSLQQALNDKAERQMQLLGGPHNEDEAAAIAKEINEITTAYEEVRAQIRVISPHYAALTQPRLLSLKEIQEQVLDDKTLLLEYALGDERSYLWAVEADGIKSYELPGRALIEKASRGVYELLLARQPVKNETLEQRQTRVAESDAQYWHQAAALSRMIIGPVAGQMGKKRLLVVADGALQYVPFGALTLPATDEASDRPAETEQVSTSEPVPLMIDHEIVSLPSASTLAVLRREMATRQPGVKTVAVLADPVFERDDPRIQPTFTAQASTKTEQAEAAELHRAVRDAGVLGDGGSIPRLLASRQEAEAIMQVTPTGAGLKAVGFDASRATATSPDLGHYRIVHFATHGLLNSEHPELSGVILSLMDQQGQPINGFLRLHDIYNLSLPVDLVVLSACNTGLGKDVKGEGLVGLTRGFMYAGAGGVVASLWKVDDEATAELMKHFYRGMLKDGLTPAAALRQAQVAMWRQNRWRSPYYWAAFVLQGEYGQRIEFKDNTQVHTSQIVAAVAIVLALTFGGGLYVARRRRRKMM